MMIKKNEELTNFNLKSPILSSSNFWQVLLVDADHKIHQATQLILENFQFDHQSVKFISAYSSREAQEILTRHTEIAVILISVILETDYGGLELVKYIREDLQNPWIRIILYRDSEGVPGESLILQYDINDFKSKLELQDQKLLTTVLIHLKSYQTIQTLLINTLNTHQSSQPSNSPDHREPTKPSESEKIDHFEGIFNIAEEAIILINEHQQIQRFNQGAEKIFGYPAQEVLGQPLDILLPESSRSIHRQHIGQFAAESIDARKMGERAKEILGRRQDGTIFPAKASISKVKVKEGFIFTVILQDITEEKQAELALKQLTNELEKRVEERTLELQQLNEKLYEEIQERVRLSQIIQNLFLGISSTTGSAFFEALVQNIAQALKVEYVYVSELIDLENLTGRTVAIWNKGEIGDNFTYSLAGTPCQEVFKKGFCFYPNHIQARFPDAELLKILNLESYLGISLVNNQNQTIGLLSILSETPLAETRFFPEVLKIFAARATAELERLQSQLALQESEEKFRQLADNVREVFYIYEIATNKLVYVNPAFEQIWGISEQELYQNLAAWQNLVHPQDRERVLGNLTSIKKRIHLQQEYRILKPNGEIRWLRSRNFPIKNQAGEVYRVAGVCEDITEQKQAQAALTKMNQNLEALVDLRTVQLQEKNAQLKLENRERRQAEQALITQEVSIRILYELISRPQLKFTDRLQGLLALGCCRFNLEMGMLSKVQGEQYEVILVQHPPEYPLLIESGSVLALDQTFCRQTLHSSEPISFNNASNSPWKYHPAYDHWSLEAYLGVQVIVWEVPYGTLNFSSLYPRTQAFQEAEYQLLQLMAQWLGSEIERQLSEQALERQFRQTVLLTEISHEIRQSLEVEQIFQTTAIKVGELFEVNRCIIHSYIPEPVAIAPVVAEYLTGEIPSLLGQAMPVADNPHLQMLLSQESPLAYNDVYREPILKPLTEFCHRVQLKSMLAIGTFYKDQPNGVIALHQCDQYRRWTADEIELLSSVAAQVGIALAQAALLSQEKQRQAELTQKNQDLEAANRAAEAASHAKTEFLANMSHEIRTPMNAILGFCDLLQTQITDPRHRAYLDSIAAGGRTLLALINDILDLSKIESGRMEIHYEPVNIRFLVREIQQIFWDQITKKKLELQVEIDDDLPEGLEFDEIRLRQILFNVVGNAIKFTHQGLIKIRVMSQALINPGLVPQIALQIDIEDTGIGIAPEQQKRIFEAFMQSEGQSTRKYGGTGLGLAITRRLTEMLGGQVQVQSIVDQGTRFSFIFPQVNVKTRRTEILNPQDIDTDLNQFQPATLLVVDDVESNRQLIQGYFSDTSHHLLMAKDGLEAINMAQLHQPDVILLDLRMPNMDGYEAAQTLKQMTETRHIPIIVLTASVFRVDHRKIQNFCESILHKPVNLAQLVSELKKILPLLPNYPATISPEITAETLIPSSILIPETPARLSSFQRETLLQALKNLETTVWPRICQTLKMRDVQQFTQQLQAVADEYPYLPLQEYVTRLQTQMEQFDWGQLPHTLSGFPDVHQTLLNSP